VTTAVLVAGGCQRRLREADCTAVEQRLRQAWLADAEAAMAASDSAEYGPWVEEQADRIGAAWLEHCRPQIGRPVRQAELDCLSAAGSIEAVYACARAE